ncbi:MAG: sulfurtransferase FdhD [Kiloniella sp.]|nr:sulfurtransferase FdhD [Kiloniella sp.]MAH87172.1 sulfurtransferase FdhD [Kiloniella sp.]
MTRNAGTGDDQGKGAGNLTAGQNPKASTADTPLRKRAKPPPIEPGALDSLILAPDPTDADLARTLNVTNERGETERVRAVRERPLTIFLNDQEIVTAMTVGDHPEMLALGYLINQGMLPREPKLDSIDYDADLGVAVVRTPEQTNFEERLKKKTLTSGCAQGTVFGDLMEQLEGVRLPDDQGPPLPLSTLARLLRRLASVPSLYLEAGGIHGCALAEADRPLIYMEDVGRHNAVDKIAGVMAERGIVPDGKIFYTTGRLTSEMVIKTLTMGVPVLVSRSGFSAWGVELAREANLTLIARAKGRRMTVLAGEQRLVFDTTEETGG